jgi:hypothetical protein
LLVVVVVELVLAVAVVREVIEPHQDLQCRLVHQLR